MSSDIEQAHPRVPSDHVPGRIGQATAVEQARAIAEVQAAVVVARDFPRVLSASIAQMQEVCRHSSLAERAFFRYNRGGSQITGPSVHLARELARCWGNVQYGIGELRRDDEHRQSEMQAWAWDVQTNARNSTTFIVPHKRDTKNGVKDLTDMRDIYENNSNAGARRVRECIFAVLPQWFIEDAKTLCDKTIVDGGGEPLARRVSRLTTGFADIGVSVDQLERKLARKVDQWTAHDVAQLSVIGKSIERGETTRDDEFPPERVTTADLTEQTTTRPAATKPAETKQATGSPDAPTEPEPPADQTPPPAPPPSRASAAKRRRITDQLKECGVTAAGDGTERRRVVGVLAGRVIGSIDDLSSDEADAVIALLAPCVASDNPSNALDGVLDDTEPPADRGEQNLFDDNEK